MTNFSKKLLGMKFASNAKVTKLLKSEASDLELAQASKTTKPYKEDAEFKSIVDGIIEKSTSTKIVEPKKSNSTRSGEPRR